MRHRISILRLLLTWPVTLAVTFGLLVVPVECTVAAGPHSIFVDAGSIASLQTTASAASVQHNHHVHAEEHVTSHLAAIGLDFSQSMVVHLPVQTADSTPTSHHRHGESPAAPETNPEQSPVKASPPSTAGFATDGVVAILLPNFASELISTESALRSLTDFQMPPDHLLRGPEPPPG